MSFFHFSLMCIKIHNNPGVAKMLWQNFWGRMTFIIKFKSISRLETVCRNPIGSVSLDLAVCGVSNAYPGSPGPPVNQQFCIMSLVFLSYGYNVAVVFLKWRWKKCRDCFHCLPPALQVYMCISAKPLFLVKSLSIALWATHNNRTWKHFDWHLPGASLNEWMLLVFRCLSYIKICILDENFLSISFIFFWIGWLKNST